MKRLNPLLELLEIDEPFLAGWSFLTGVNKVGGKNSLKLKLFSFSFEDAIPCLSNVSGF